MNIPWQFAATGQEDTYRIAVRLYLQDLAQRALEHVLPTKDAFLVLLLEDSRELTEGTEAKG